MALTPQKKLAIALNSRQWAAAEKALANGASVIPDGSGAWCNLAMKALGPLGMAPAEKLEGWRWLQSHGFQFDGQGDVEKTERLLETLLSREPIETLKWLDDQGFVSKSGSNRVAGAIKRQDMDGLEWLAERGEPLDTSPPVLPSILLAITWQKMSAAPHIEWLLDHGVQPLSNAHLLANPLALVNRPLHAWGQAFYGATDGVNHTPDRSLLVRFERIWNRLIAAGDDPNAQTTGFLSAQGYLELLNAYAGVQALRRQVKTMAEDRPCEAIATKGRARARP
jgi:hypothetical protein